jgi:putative ABC transport system permease protein
MLGGAVGLLVGAWASQAIWPKFILEIMPTGWVDSFNFGLDWRVFEYATILSLITGVAFGLFPALETTRASISTGLKQDSAFWGQRVSRSRLRNFLVVGQVAVSLTLLIVTSLMLRRIQTGIRREFGFETEHVLMLDFSSFSTHPREFQDSLLERIRAIPGVESAAAARVWYGQHVNENLVLIDGQPPNRRLGLNQSKVTPAYFTTLGIAIIRGRNFTDAEARNNSPVVIVSETFATKFWPDQDAIGHRLRIGPESADAEVIGVAKDGVTEIRSQYELEGYSGDLYAPLTAADKPEIWVRTSGDPQAIMPILWQAIPQLDKDVRFGGRRLKEMAGQWIRPTELLAGAVGTIGVLAMLLVSCGLYGVMAYAVTQRRQEIGIRMAVGAQKGAIMKLMLWQGMQLVVAGIAFGLVGSGALSIALRSVLYGLSPFDPITFGGVSLCLVVVALAACYVPARAATRVDPMVALRAE